MYTYVIKKIMKHPIVAITIMLGPIVAILFIIFFIIGTLTSEEGGTSCNTSSSSDDSNVSISGVSGAWTQKGTKAYNLAKTIYSHAKGMGCDDAHAAAVVGNAECEGASQGTLSLHQGGGSSHFTGSGQASGIFQFEQQPKYGWSLDGQIKSIFALAGGPGPQCSSSAGSASHWKKMSGSPASLAVSFECTFERGGEPVFDKRKSFAQKAYSIFNGTGGAGGDASSSSSQGNNACSKSGSGGDAGTDYIAYGEKFKGMKYSSNSGQRDKGAEEVAKGPVNKSDDTDCSGFVWGILKHCGYGTSSTPWTCGSGADENSYFKEHNETVDKPNTKAGTIVIANSNPHTAVLLNKWSGPTSTGILNEGGRTSWNDVNTDKYGYAFGATPDSNPPSEFANPKKN